MGWSSGTELFSETIKTLKHWLKDHDKLREAIYVELIMHFEEADWDCQQECLGEDPAYDAAYYKLYPEEELEEKGTK